MKKRLILPIFSLLSISLVGCKKEVIEDDPTKDWEIYHEDYVYEDPQYEVLDLSKENAYPYSIRVDNIPTEGIPQATWDEYNIKLHCFYSDGSTADVPLYERNLPVECRHYLGEVGEHKLHFAYGIHDYSIEFKVINNPEWKGFNCYFFNMDNKLIHTQIVGYYASLHYSGPDISEKEEDDDYLYHFTGWNQSTKYIHQDMQYRTQYEKIEKRMYAIKPAKDGYSNVAGIVDSANNKGNSLFYLGRVHRVAAVYSSVAYMTPEGATVEFDYSDYGSFFKEINQSIIGLIKYEHDPNYDSLLYGSVASILMHPEYSMLIDERYEYEGGRKVYLENGKEIQLSAQDPYVYLSNRVLDFVNPHSKASLEKDELGYYRAAVVFDFDVYLSMSYRRIGNNIFEIGAFNRFVVCPDTSTVNYVIQNSKDGKFEDNFDTHLSLSEKAVYNNAAMLDWDEWQS